MIPESRIKEIEIEAESLNVDLGQHEMFKELLAERKALVAVAEAADNMLVDCHSLGKFVEVLTAWKESND